MLSPSNPDVDGDNKVVFDGMDEAGHRKQADKGGRGESIKEEDAHEGNPESTRQEKEAEDEE